VHRVVQPRGSRAGSTEYERGHEYWELELVARAAPEFERERGDPDRKPTTGRRHATKLCALD
jgi:hypothetical protein